MEGRFFLIPNDKLQIFSHLQSHKYPKMLMKAARAGFEGVNKMHYEFINARTFISTNKNAGSKEYYQGQANSVVEKA